MKIEAIEVTIVDIPTTRPLKMSFTTVQQQSYVIVQVRAEGLVGIGEGASIGGPTWGEECAETIKAIIESYLVPLLIGKNASNIAQLHWLMESAVTGNRSAKAAIDVALHDLKARSLGIALSDLLGGRVRSGIPIAWTLASGDTARDIASAQEMIERKRHNLFKLKLGAAAPADDLRHVQAIAKALEGSASIRVDANQAWDESTAAQWIPRLAQAGVELVEQPVPRSNVRALKRLSDANSVPIMADESLGGLSAAFDLARDHSVDVFSLKLCNLGGVGNTLKVAGIAEAAAISLYGGTMLDSAVGTAAALNVYSTLPSLPFGCELLGPWLLTDRLTTAPLEIKNFEVLIPSGVGIGVDLDHDKLRYYARK